MSKQPKASFKAWPKTLDRQVQVVLTSRADVQARAAVAVSLIEAQVEKEATA